ncbi:hypothetical protein ACVWZL_007350 [Bradyrhizobium sp. GM2.4]
MNHRAKRQALAGWCDTAHWRAIVAVTLNLKQSVLTPDGGYVLVDEQACKKAFKRFSMPSTEKFTDRHIGTTKSVCGSFQSWSTLHQTAGTIT